MSSHAYVNRIATAVPENEVNGFFVRFAASMLSGPPRQRAVFMRMMEASGIDRRYSCVVPAADAEAGAVDRDGLFARGAFPGTARRMAIYEQEAPRLAETAVERLLDGEDKSRVTHLVVTSCTGFSAPGVDLELVARCRLPSSVERTVVGFMGCYAAVTALKLARHIVRSDPDARVLVVNIELCTLHLQETADLEKLLSFCLWGDGCAAALVTSEPRGIRLDRFRTMVDQDTGSLMSWRIQDGGFDMVLSGQVPGSVHRLLTGHAHEILGNRRAEEIALWAIHPGGRSILDAVQRALALDAGALQDSREVLRLNGNMSSATVMFVLQRMIGARPGLSGCGMAFGPGLVVEAMAFETV